MDSTTAMLSSLLNMTVGLAMVGLVTKSFKTLDMFFDLGTSDIAWRLQRAEKDLNEYIGKLKGSPVAGTLLSVANIIRDLEATYRRLVPIAERKGFADLAEAFKDMQALCGDADGVYEFASRSHRLHAGWTESPLIEVIENVHPIVFGKGYGKEYVERVFNKLKKARDSVSRAVGRYVFLYSTSAQAYSALDLARDIAELHSTLLPVIREKLKI